jgi:hypothetical protein
MASLAQADADEIESDEEAMKQVQAYYGLDLSLHIASL